MTIDDFTVEHGMLVSETPGCLIQISKHTWCNGKPSGRWMTDIQAEEISICATYPRRIDAINGVDKLLRAVNDE